MEYKKILIVSDLHMTSGKDPCTGVWAVTEDFFWDRDFRRFLEYYENHSPSLLVINGDLFDFMQVLLFPDEEEKKKYNISDSEINLRYGLRTSEPASVFQIDKIIEGHPEFFKALASFICKGNYVKILKGNHDIQIFWPEVQKRMINKILEICSDENKNLITANIEFLPWFFYIPGKIYIEHGNQYEYTTSFRNFLYPYLPFDYDGVSRQIELDLSSFLVRYFSNRLEPVNPLSDNVRPLSKFLGEFWKSNPYVFITSSGTALRYLLKAFSKAKTMSKMKKESAGVDEQNRKLIKTEAVKYYPEDEKQRERFEKNLFRIDNLKAEPILSSGPFRFLWNMLKEPLKGLLWLLPLYALFILPDLMQPFRDQVGRMQDSFWKSLLNLIFTLKIPELFLVFATAIILISIRTWLRKRKGDKETPSGEVKILMRERAKVIAGMLNVRFVVFGHTHYADISMLSENSFYYNTGTWMGVFAPEEELYRNVKQFTFFHLEKETGSLLHWNADRDEPEPVVIVDPEIPLTGDEDSILRILFSSFKAPG